MERLKTKRGQEMVAEFSPCLSPQLVGSSSSTAPALPAGCLVNEVQKQPNNRHSVVHPLVALGCISTQTQGVEG